ncbi:PAS/PAC sensor signal transduction histidine kinase [Natrialba chahannaoensis JCM 10990]|uniref:histidine kinase n=1 Tax=Natrialba chahannaoensis JCM 10990 TaxID=1227492 RepID=M0AP10_9EURY|nr:PAS/PAC sensor signal transduction histidine kinase [Natrialba chahannaoensis JCM 10990]
MSPLATVLGDASQLRKVFQNLLTNAIEYSGDEPPTITVSTERDGEQWLVLVRDVGIGLEPSQQERVFEGFDPSIVTTSTTGRELDSRCAIGLSSAMAAKFGWNPSRCRNDGFVYLASTAMSCGAIPCLSDPRDTNMLYFAVTLPQNVTPEVNWSRLKPVRSGGPTGR